MCGAAACCGSAGGRIGLRCFRRGMLGAVLAGDLRRLRRIDGNHGRALIRIGLSIDGSNRRLFAGLCGRVLGGGRSFGRRIGLHIGLGKTGAATAADSAGSPTTAASAAASFCDRDRRFRRSQWRSWRHRRSRWKRRLRPLHPLRLRRWVEPYRSPMRWRQWLRQRSQAEPCCRRCRALASTGVAGASVDATGTGIATPTASTVILIVVSLLNLGAIGRRRFFGTPPSMPVGLRLLWRRSISIWRAASVRAWRPCRHQPVRPERCRASEAAFFAGLSEGALSRAREFAAAAASSCRRGAGVLLAGGVRFARRGCCRRRPRCCRPARQSCRLPARRTFGRAGAPWKDRRRCDFGCDANHGRPLGWNWPFHQQGPGHGPSRNKI